MADALRMFRFISPKYFSMMVILFFSKLFRLSGLRACRFYPSCSEYSLQAFRQLNFFKAVGITIHRLLRCHPFASGGYNPLPNARPRSLDPSPSVGATDSPVISRHDVENVVVTTPSPETNPSICGFASRTNPPQAERRSNLPVRQAGNTDEAFSADC